MTRIRHFRYGVAKSGERQSIARLAGHHGEYGGLVEVTPRKHRRREEDAIQRSIVHLLQIHRNAGSLVFFAVPNGERRDKVTGAKLKRQGVIAGAPDLVVMQKFRPPIFVEVKARDGRSSKAQREFSEACARLGQRYVIVRSIEDMAEALKGE